MITLVRWRIFEGANGHRFLMGATVAGAAVGPIEMKTFDPTTMRVSQYEIVGPPAYDDQAQYELETGWSIDRNSRDVTAKACRELGVSDQVFAAYMDGWTPKKTT